MGHYFQQHINICTTTTPYNMIVLHKPQQQQQQQQQQHLITSMGHHDNEITFINRSVTYHRFLGRR